MARVRTLGDRCRASRDLVARWWSGSRPVSIKAQLAAGAGIFALSAWVTVTSVSYLGSRHLLSDAARTIETLEQAYADLLAESQLLDRSFTEQLDALKATDQRQRAAIGELGSDPGDARPRSSNRASGSSPASPSSAITPGRGSATWSGAGRGQGRGCRAR